MKVCEFTDYRRYLQRELEARTQKNPRFSLRSYAEFLDLSPSHLSRVINGKKKLSLEAATKLSNKLKHKKEETQHFLDLVQLEGTDSEDYKNELLQKISKRASKYQKEVFTFENFNLISDWYHFAILSMLKLNDFKPSPLWISKRLGITQLEAKIAIKRLVDLELLEIVDDKYQEVSDYALTTTDEVSSIAIKNNHKQHIKKSLAAIDQQHLDVREYNNCTVAIKMSDMPKIKQKLRKVMNDLNDELDTDGGDELYQLNYQFFRLTQVVSNDNEAEVTK